MPHAEPTTTQLDTWRVYTQLTGQLHPDSLLPAVYYCNPDDPLTWITLEEYAANDAWSLMLLEGFNLSYTQVMELFRELRARMEGLTDTQE